MTPFRGAKFDGALRHLGADLEVCAHGWVALMCESEPPGGKCLFISTSPACVSVEAKKVAMF